MNASLSNALAAWKAGRDRDARDEAAALWESARDYRAATLIALIELDSERTESALTWTQRALDVNPKDARLHVQAGRLNLALRKRESAVRSFETAAQIDPQLGTARLELGKALAMTGENERAIAMLREALRLGADRDEALQALVDAVPVEPPAAVIESVVTQAREAISVIVCSIDDERYSRAFASYSYALADWPHEFVRINDARSLAEGYTRGLSAARAPLVIFTHDDVELLNDALGHRLTRHLRRCEIVGVAGAERATGPSWAHAGHPWLHGAVLLPASNGYEINVYSEKGPLIPGMGVLDGVFLAMRRDTAVVVGWDAVTFNHFHAYDIDFTLRAAKLGMRLAAATDLGLLHYSRGSYGEAWQRESAKLVAKHPELGEVRSVTVKGYGRLLDSVGAVRSFCSCWAT